MSSVLLDQLCGPLLNVSLSDVVLGRTVKYGQHCDVTFNIKGEYERTQHRHGALFTNVLSPIGKLDFDLITDVRDYSGFNGRVINSSGALDQEALMECLKSSHRYRGIDIFEVTNTFCDSVHESHTSVILNLLRMWLYTKIDPEKVTVSPEDKFYDDGHVSQTYKQHLGYDFMPFVEVEFNSYLRVTKASADYALGQFSYCPNLNGFNDEEVCVLGMALAGWRCDYPLRFMSTTPAIASELVIPFHSNKSTMFLPVTLTEELVLNTLNKLVFNNRLTCAFDQAYLLLASVIFTPMPRAAEANAWVSPNTRFHLPMAGTSRGAIREMTIGQAYTRAPSSLVTWNTFKQSRPRLIMHAIALTEALYTGLFELMTYKSRGFMDTMNQLGLTGAAADTPYHFVMACAAYRFGKEFELKHDMISGPDFVTPILSAQEAKPRDVYVDAFGDYSDYNVIKTEIGGAMILRLVTKVALPALHPVLSTGINDNRYYLNAYSYSTRMTYSIHRDAYGCTDANSANKFMSIMRIGGYDVEGFDGIDGKRYKNWAANSNGQVMPMVQDQPDGMSAFIFPRASMRKRKHNWIDLERDRTTLEVGITLKPITYALYVNGKTERPITTRYEPLCEVPERWDQEKSAGFVYKTKATLGKYEFQDFVIAEANNPETTSQFVLQDMSKSQSTEPLMSQDGLDAQALEEEQ